MAGLLVNWLREMGPYRPGAFAWIVSGAALFAFVMMGAWFQALLVAGVILGALVLTYLRRGDGERVIRLTWAESRSRAAQKAPRARDIEMDVPLIGVMQHPQLGRGYAWVEFDPETSIWDIALLNLRWHSFHRYQYFGELSLEEFESHVSRLGLNFLAQDFYAKAVWDEYFDA